MSRSLSAIPWGTLQTTASPAHVLETARALSKRGKLPGFQVLGPSRVLLEAFAHPFTHDVNVVLEPAGERTLMTGTLVMRRRLPIIFAIVGLVSLWPGVWLTDSMIRTYFPSYDFNTNLWYLPLTLISLVWYAISATKASRKEATKSGEEALRTLADALPQSSLSLRGEAQTSSTQATRAAS